MAKRPDDGTVTVATNRAARHNYFLGDTYECGIVLRGSEVKSLREAKAQITEAFGQFSGGELYLHNLQIAQYSHSHRATGHEPLRVRKLLLHRRELDRIRAKLQTERLSIVPTRLYFKDGKAKVEIALGVGKTKGDKRQDMAKRDAQSDIRQAMGRAIKEGR
jgi:SsrA-binding protein